MLFPEGLLRDALNITIIVFTVSISILYQDVTFILDWLLHLPIWTRLGLPQFEHVVINYNRWSLKEIPIYSETRRLFSYPLLINYNRLLLVFICYYCRMSKRGSLIIFEGVDRCGKTTQVKIKLQLK